MLKQIQHLFATIPTDGTFVEFDYTVLPGKVCIFLQGEGFGHTGYYDGTNFVAFGWQVPPIILSVATDGCSVTFSETPADPIQISLQVIEYL